MARKVLGLTKGGKPPWLKMRYCPSENFVQTKEMNQRLGLRTVCDSAHCPNIGECWGERNSTYLIMGDVCTRACRFCAVTSGRPEVAIDISEPERVAEAVLRSGLRYVVVTAVTRDDLEDGGASVFASTVAAIRSKVPDCGIELLIPDLQGHIGALEAVVGSAPEVIGHNIEVVERLQGQVRDRRASYAISLRVLQEIKRHSPGQITKSSLMLGLGETEEEIMGCLRDLRAVKVDILTMGQYLRPTANQVSVVRYVHPGEFEHYRMQALTMGFKAVVAGPFVRSSYKAHEAYQIAKGE